MSGGDVAALDPYESTASASVLPPLVSEGPAPSEGQRVQSSTGLISGVVRFLGNQLPFSEAHQRRRSLIHYRGSLQSELVTLRVAVLRAQAAIKTRQHEGRRLRSRGAADHRHAILHQYYSCLQRKLAQTEYEIYGQSVSVLESREREADLLLGQPAEILKAQDGPDGGFAVPPSKLLSRDITIATLRRQLAYLHRAYTKAREDVLVSRRSMARAAQSTLEDRQGKLQHIIREHTAVIEGLLTGKRESYANSVGPASGGQRAAGFAPDSFPRRREETKDAYGLLQRSRRRDMWRIRRKYEEEFASFLEDECHREGRLLRRWINLVNGTIRDEREDIFETSEHGPVGRQFRTPCCILAFIRFLLHTVRRVYQLDSSLTAGLSTLLQGLVFRRCRRICLGYTSVNGIGDLHAKWRKQLEIARQLTPTALGVPLAYRSSKEVEKPTDRQLRKADDTAEDYRRLHGPSEEVLSDEDKRSDQPMAFHHTSAALDELALWMTPGAMCGRLMTAIECLHIEAALIANEEQVLDADTVLPLLIYALSRTDVPDIFSCLYCLRNFAAGDIKGEKAYYLTCLEAAVKYIMDLPEGSAVCISRQAGEAAVDMRGDALESGGAMSKPTELPFEDSNDISRGESRRASSDGLSVRRPSGSTDGEEETMTDVDWLPVLSSAERAKALQTLFVWLQKEYRADLSKEMLSEPKD